MNEKKYEKMKNQMITKNSLLSNNRVSLSAIYLFFVKYLKRQKILSLIVILFLPVFFTCDMFLLQNISLKFMPLTTGFLFILLGFCGPIYIIGSFLVDLKSSVVYKRIGLTGIKPIGFLLVVIFYCLTVTIITDFIGFLIGLIIIMSKSLSLFYLFNWNTLILFILSIFTSILLTVIMNFFIIFINSTIIQSLVTSFLAVITFAPCFLLNAFSPLIFANGLVFFTINELIIIILVFVIIICLIFLFICLINKLFYWVK